MTSRAIIALLTCLLFWGCSSSPESRSLQQDLTQRAHQAALRMMADTDGTLHDINTGKTPYVRSGHPETYVYVYDLNLDVVAHPDSAIRGTNHAQEVDVNRIDYPQRMLSRALARKKGQEGWIEYSTDGYDRVAYYELAQGRNGFYYIVVATTPIGRSYNATRQQDPASAKEIRMQRDFGQGY